MNKQTIKSIILSVVLLGVSILFWYSLSKAFTGPTINILIGTGVCLIIWAAVVGVYCMIVKKNIIAWPAFFLSLLSFLIFFGFGINYLIGILMLFLVLIIARSRIIKEVLNRIKISPRKSLRRILSIALTFIFLFIALVYYSTPVIGAENVEVPRSWFKPFENPVAGLLEKTAPMLNIKGMTLDDFITMDILIKQCRETEIFSKALKDVPANEIGNYSTEELLELIKKDPKSQELLIQELRKEYKKIDPILMERERAEISEVFGVILEGGDSLTDVLHKLVNQKIDQLMGPYKRYVPLIVAVILFLVLQGSMIIIKPLVLAVAEILFQIFVWTKFVKIGMETKEAEVIEL